MIIPTLTTLSFLKFLQISTLTLAPNLNLVNEPNLTRILQSEIFIHTNGQLRAIHLILGYKPISTGFQAPMHVIKVKDPWLHQINIVVLGFLTRPPTP